LRRQFSLDKDDLSTKNHGTLETISSLVDTKHLPKSNYQPLISSSSLPANSNLISTKLPKHQSDSAAQDLEKIEEIPISPVNTSLLPLNRNKKVSKSFKHPNSNNNSKTTTSNDSKDVNINIESFK
jgi:hypothetical protein